MASSTNISRVPVKNIYYMLVYAWKHPYEKNLISIYDEDEKDLVNLLCKVLIVKVKSLIKRGFYTEYFVKEEESGIIRGKILFKESLQKLSHKRAKMYISEEEMSVNNLHNQLIKSSLHLLLEMDNIELESRKELERVISYFRDINLIKLDSKLFKSVSLHRNNQHYGFILNVCQFIWENVFIHEGEGEKELQDFSRDHYKMAALFENFVKNFYQKEIQSSKVKSEIMKWPAVGEMLERLPIMETDISLEFEGQKYIIDTKFAHKAFKGRYSKKSVESPYVYQLFSYLINDEYKRKEKAKGILLYPKVDESFLLNDNIHGFDITICTVDLDQNWQSIHKRLLEIVGVSMQPEG